MKTIFINNLSQNDQFCKVPCLLFDAALLNKGCLIIIPRMRVGYELLDSTRDAEHRFDYYKLVSNKREWNIKYQMIDFVYVHPC